LSRLINVEFPLPHYFRLFEYGQVGLLSLNCLTFHISMIYRCFELINLFSF